MIYPMPGNNATRMINFTDLRKRNFVHSLSETVFQNTVFICFLSLLF